MPPLSGTLAVVLHTHMPYVEGHGTWPHGEEWLWEACATSYGPLLDVLEGVPAITLSVTPVLLDQLEAPGVAERFATWIRDVRLATFALDAAEAADPAVARELERAAGDYAGRSIAGLAERLVARADWTSSATHAVLPLLATDAGVRLQVATGVAAHRRRRGARGWAGGLWSPECAHAPWLDPLLAREGVRATCVELTDVPGIDPHRPLRAPGGPVLAPIDRVVVDLVWGRGGYPAGAAYRDSHRRTRLERKPWRNDGAVYDPAAARAQARADAADFVARVRGRVAAGGLCVLALDTELLGHWWHEGVTWLAAVVDECARQGLPLAGLDDALAARAPAPAPVLPVTTWGHPRDLTTWSAPPVADVAWAQRAAELALVARAGEATDADARRLLALQASDWAFAITTGQAAPYARERIAAARGDGPLRGIAPWARAAALRAP